MEGSFLGVPGVDGWLFAAFAAASFCTAFLGLLMGAAGGLVLLALMALAFPPAVLIPMHTVVQLGVASSRTLMMWRYVMRNTLLPFTAGTAVGAAAGAQVFVALPTTALQAILAAFILAVTWLPTLGRVGSLGGRFAALGFGATFLGMFVSSTGTLLAPFIASANPDRRGYIATLATQMAIVHIAKLVAFGVLGTAFGAYLPLALAMVCTAALGNMAARRVLDRMPERTFRTVLKLVLTALALRLLWIAAKSAGWA
jgi:uncharacterized membrane protein YfcA